MSEHVVPSYKSQLEKSGYVVISSENLINQVKNANTLFNESFRPKMSIHSPNLNRELIKRFADHPMVVNLFCSDHFVKILIDELKFATPVKCGPTVTHYTSMDITGSGYGLPFHQDFPSMASSINSIVCWLNLVDSNQCSHGIELIPEVHHRGLCSGKQTDDGYILNENSLTDFKSVIPSIKAGELLIMSSFLPHKTFINNKFEGWKLSISQRFDDLNDDDWAQRGYKNAYSTAVDRKMYLTVL